ncbi:MAG: peptide-methionine (R)-S-oxide reductase MsrB [Pseudomonadota bacterium]
MPSDTTTAPKIEKSETEWRAQLSPEAYRVTREHGTEPPHSHPYNHVTQPGRFDCVCCGAPLFATDAKFDSGTGWPSFTSPITPDAVSEHTDRSWFQTRTEIRCASCDSHLGHVFPDGPRPTGLRYCMNGVALTFEPEVG